MRGRREFLRSGALLALIAACNPGALFGPRRRALAMGASVFTGWASPRPEYGLVPGVQCPNLYPWQAMLAADRVPALGQYDEREQSVTDWRLSQMERGGVEWVTYQHEWSPDRGALIMNHCAENHPSDSAVSFAMSWWDVLTNSTDGLTYYADPKWTQATVAESLRAYGRACRPFTEKASYLRIDGRPVLFRGVANSLEFYSRWSLSPNDVLDLIAEAFSERPYFVATSCDHSYHARLKSWGFDAFTEYTLNAGSWAIAMQTYRDFWAHSLTIARATGIDFWVPALAGFDARGYLNPEDALKLGYFEPPSPADFTAHLTEARAVAERKYDVTRGRVITYAWSEFYEGGILEPLAPGGIHNGDEMLMAHAAACGLAAAA